MPDHESFLCIPGCLREEDRWVAWNLVSAKEPGKKSRKLPINPNSGKAASSTDPNTWASFEQAVACAQRHNLAGVGYQLDGSGNTGFDWDDCRNPDTGEIQSGVLADLELLQSYAEISPSGRGIRAIARGKLPPGGRKKKGIEMYDSGRFLTFTGRCLEQFPSTIKERLDEIGVLHARHFALASPRRNAESQSGSDLTDDEVIERASTNSKFAALWAGDRSAYPSQSEAELALVSLLAFWTGPDPERIDRIFRRSKLLREKWDSRRGATTYGRITIDTALAGKTEFHRSASSEASSACVRIEKPPLTDSGNAEWLVRRFGNDLRYCHPWKSWLVWQDGRWRNDQIGFAMARTKDVARTLYAEASRRENAKVAGQMAGWARSSEKVDRRKAMVTLAQCERGIPIHPGELDRHPFLLNCPNGTLDLQVFELLPHRREDYLTKLCPTRYIPGSPCPTWIAFLERVLPDDEVRSYTQRLLGYSLTGDVSEQNLVIANGEGQNGKSTLFVTVQRVLTPAYAIQISTDLLLAKDHPNHPTEIADLFGVRLAIGTESPKNKELDERLAKLLTGCDRLRARRMREDFWEFEPTHKLVMVTNHLPRVTTSDFALVRRLHVLPFEVRIPESEKDKKLLTKLRREREGILAWMVEGCRQWRERGLDPPEQVLLYQARAAARPKLPVEEFVEQFVVRKPGERVRATTLYQAFTGWCAANGHAPISQTDFGTYLGQAGFGSKKSHGVIVYLDLAPKPAGGGLGMVGTTFPVDRFGGAHEEENGGSGPHCPQPSPGRVSANGSPPPECVLGPVLTDQCYACGSRRWWRLREGTTRVCGICHPPPADETEVVWGGSPVMDGDRSDA